MLDVELSALRFMLKSFPEIKEEEEMRRSIGRYGLTGKQQVQSEARSTNLRTVAANPPLQTGTKLQ